MPTKKSDVLRSVRVNAKNKPPEHYFATSLQSSQRQFGSFPDIYFVITIQIGSIDWKKGEFVISPNVPSDDLMPKAEIVEEPEFAT